MRLAEQPRGRVKHEVFETSRLECRKTQDALRINVAAAATTSESLCGMLCLGLADLFVPHRIWYPPATGGRPGRGIPAGRPLDFRRLG
jgi:hypothetical protein